MRRVRPHGWVWGNVLTTTVDGLWVLQVLTGIEVVAPELGLRPHLPRVEHRRLALKHPVADELRSVGAVTDSGDVDGALVELLTVLSRRDMALLMRFRVPGDDDPARALIARFAQWWVVMERHGDFIRISGAGTADAEGTASGALMVQIERLCGANSPAALRPVTLSAGALREAATSSAALREFLEKQSLDGDQLRMLLMAADPKRAAQASIVALQSGVNTGRPTRTHVEQNAVAIIDTPEGRLVTETVSAAGKDWIITASGTRGNLATAVGNMLRRLPAGQQWFSYRKVV